MINRNCTTPWPKSRPAAVIVVQRQPIPVATAGDRERNPNAACRRLGRGSTGTHRLKGYTQADPVFQRRIDRKCGQLAASATLAPPGRHPFHPGPAQPILKTG